MANTNALCDDVFSLLKRLDAAVSNQSSADALAQLEALGLVTVTLPVLSRTKCGAVIAKLRSHSDSRVAAAAGALVRTWKKIAEDGGATRKADGTAPAAAATATPTAAGTSAVATAVATGASSPSSSATGLTRERSDASTNSAGDLTAKAEGATATAKASSARVCGGGTPPAASVPLLPALPPARAKPCQIFIDTLGKILKDADLTTLVIAPREDESSIETLGDIGSSSGGGVAAASVSAASSSAGAVFDVATMARVEATKLEASLFFQYGGPHSDRPAKEYSEKFRAVAMALPRHAALALNVFNGSLSWDDVVQMGAEDLLSEAAREKAATMRKEA